MSHPSAPRLPPPDDPVARALGRTVWHGLQLGAVMARIAREIGRPEDLISKVPRAQLRKDLVIHLPQAGLSPTDETDLLEWLQRIAEPVDEYEELGLSTPATVMELGPPLLQELTFLLENAAAHGDHLHTRIWPRTEVHS
jgi:hypothetical protein